MFVFFSLYSEKLEKKQVQDKIGENTIKKLSVNIYIKKSLVLYARSIRERSVSSNGRALASHARGKGIDAPLFQNLNFFKFSYSVSPLEFLVVKDVELP